MSKDRHPYLGYENLRHVSAAAHAPTLMDPSLLGYHRADEVRTWVQSLRYFSFLGGVWEDHFEQDEELALYLRFEGRDDLVMMLDRFGILAPGDGRPPSVVAGESPYNIQAFPDLLEPRDCKVAGVACNVRVLSTSILVTLKEGGSGVTESRVADARRLETLLDELAFGTRTIPLDWNYVVRASDLA